MIFKLFIYLIMFFLCLTVFFLTAGALMKMYLFFRIQLSKIIHRGDKHEKK